MQLKEQYTMSLDTVLTFTIVYAVMFFFCLGINDITLPKLMRLGKSNIMILQKFSKKVNNSIWVQKITMPSKKGIFNLL